MIKATCLAIRCLTDGSCIIIAIIVKECLWFSYSVSEVDWREAALWGCRRVEASLPLLGRFFPWFSGGRHLMTSSGWTMPRRVLRGSPSKVGTFSWKLFSLGKAQHSTLETPLSRSLGSFCLPTWRDEKTAQGSIWNCKGWGEGIEKIAFYLEKTTSVKLCWDLVDTCW